MAKHTREQDEQYILSLLRQTSKASAPKRLSEHPQNICAQAPNVFSRNEYEPAPNKKSQQQPVTTTTTTTIAVGALQPIRKVTTITTTAAAEAGGGLSSVSEMGQKEAAANEEQQKQQQRDEEMDEEEEESAENEMLRRLGATYANEINEIDFDNPQLYHEIFTKSSNVKSTFDKLMNVNHNSNDTNNHDESIRSKGT